MAELRESLEAKEKEFTERLEELSSGNEAELRRLSQEAEEKLQEELEKTRSGMIMPLCGVTYILYYMSNEYIMPQSH